MTIQLINLEDTFHNVRTVAIAGHIRPDGDCIGSCLALYLYIKVNFPNLQTEVYLEPISDKFYYLKGADKIINSFQNEKEYDLFISLDSSDKERLGYAAKLFDKAKKTLCIDHHISNLKFADDNYVLPDASSTCEVLFGLFDNEKIDRDIAEALYTGIIHDTGVFKHSNTTPVTFEAAAKLIAKGIPFSKIIDETFYQKTYVQNQILGRALLESIIFMDGRCIYTAVTKSEMDFYGITGKDMDGIIDQIRITKDVECAIFIYETGLHEYKVSMRSNDYVDVSKIASLFGGGGHIRAAGCTMVGTEHDVINNLAAQIEKQMKQEKFPC